MGADLVPAVGHLADELGERLGHVAEDEERGRGARAVEDLEQPERRGHHPSRRWLVDAPEAAPDEREPVLQVDADPVAHRRHDRGRWRSAYAWATRSNTRRWSNRSWASARPRSPIRRRAAGSSSSAPMADASRSGSRTGTIVPVSPST